MKASELRIGNLVNYNEGGIFKVIGIHEFGIDCENEIETTYMEYENFKPIPLTEEWLLKFGFKNNRLGLFDCVKVGDDIGYHIYFIGKHLKEVQYVHQLQNLYFALTGEELTIKDEFNRKSY